MRMVTGPSQVGKATLARQMLAALGARISPTPQPLGLTSSSTDMTGTGKWISSCARARAWSPDVTTFSEAATRRTGDSPTRKLAISRPQTFHLADH